MSDLATPTDLDSRRRNAEQIARDADIAATNAKTTSGPKSEQALLASIDAKIARRDADHLADHDFDENDWEANTIASNANPSLAYKNLQAKADQLSDEDHRLREQIATAPDGNDKQRMIESESWVHRKLEFVQAKERDVEGRLMDEGGWNNPDCAINGLQRFSQVADARAENAHAVESQARNDFAHATTDADRDVKADTVIDARANVLAAHAEAKAIHARLDDAYASSIGLTTSRLANARAEHAVLTGTPSAQDEAKFFESMKGNHWPTGADAQTPLGGRLATASFLMPNDPRAQLLAKVDAGTPLNPRERAQFEALYREVALEGATQVQVNQSGLSDYNELLAEPLSNNALKDPKVQAKLDAFIEQQKGRDPVTLIAECYPSKTSVAKVAPDSDNALVRVFAHVRAGTASPIEKRIFLDTVREILIERAQKQTPIKNDAYALSEPASAHVTHQLFGDDAKPNGVPVGSGHEASISSFWSSFDDTHVTELGDATTRARIVDAAKELAYHQAIKGESCYDWSIKAYALAAPELTKSTPAGEIAMLRQVFPAGKYDESYKNAPNCPREVPCNVNPNNKAVADARSDHPDYAKLQPGDWVVVNNQSGGDVRNNPGTHSEIFLGWVDEKNREARIAFGPGGEMAGVITNDSLWGAAIVKIDHPAPRLPNLPEKVIPAPQTPIEPQLRVIRI